MSYSKRSKSKGNKVVKCKLQLSKWLPTGKFPLDLTYEMRSFYIRKMQFEFRAAFSVSDQPMMLSSRLSIHVVNM